MGDWFRALDGMPKLCLCIRQMESTARPPAPAARRLAAWALLGVVVLLSCWPVWRILRRPEAGGVPGIIPDGPAAPLRHKIEALTGGPTRLVWARDLGQGKDTFATGTKLVLMGFDTRRPEGERVLQAKRRNYSRPLLSPDGETVVFSERRKLGEGKAPAVVSAIHAVNWHDGSARLLRPGYAVEVWRDPATARIWVYAFSRLRDGMNANPEGFGLVRFPLDQPEHEEMIHEEGLMGGDNFQLNRSGTLACGLMPWPNTGTFDFKSGQFLRHDQGCWPSLAPDDSGVLWIFDGTHENLRFSLPGVEQAWRVHLGDLEVLKGKAAYHPRWSNHPQIFCFTGPHPSRVKEGSGRVSVILGRLDPSLTGVEEALSLQNASGEPDCYPDVWVAGGETVSLDRHRIGTEAIRTLAASPRPPGKEWQAPAENLRFVWQRSTADNTLPAEKRECSVQPKRHARYGPRFDLLTEGGFFVLDPDSATAVRQTLAEGPWSLELAITPLRTDGKDPQVIFRSGPGFELQQIGSRLVLNKGGKVWDLEAGLAAGQTTHVVLGSQDSREDAAPQAWLQGQGQTFQAVPADSPSSLPLPAGREVQFGARADGSAPWSGRVETVAIHAAAPDPGVAAAHAAWWKERVASERPVPRTVVRAKLKEASPRATPDSIGTYRRSWTSAWYEKTVLISGPDPGAEFGAAHWTLLDRTPLNGPPGLPGEERELTLEPMSAHPEMDSEHGSEEILPDALPMYLEMTAPVP